MKRIFTLLLLILTVALAGAAIFAGYYLTREDTAPDDSSASSCTDPFGCWGQWRIFIGGLPDINTQNQFATCVLFENPCSAHFTGHDSACYCPGYYVGSIGCADPPRQEGFRNPRTFTRAGLGCAQICGDGLKHANEQCDDGNTVNGDGCDANCTVPQQPVCGNGQVEGTEQCDDGNTNNEDACSNACTPTLTCYRCTVGLDDENTCESQVVSTASCPTGWTTNSACEQEVEGDQCPQETEIVDCGETCESSEQCGTGQTCDAGICKRDICLEDGACSDDSCTPVGCGDGNVDPGEECGEPGLSCAQGTRCVTASCSCESNSCGDPCSSDLECPNGHRCDTTRGNCVIELCLNNSNCTNNGCTLPGLPGTSLIGKTQDRLLIGILAILIGLVAIRFNTVNKLLEPLGRMESVYDLIPESGFKSKLRGKKKEEFEDKFDN